MLKIEITRGINPLGLKKWKFKGDKSIWTKNEINMLKNEITRGINPLGLKMK